MHLPAVVARISGQPWRFLVFCDDLAFEADDSAYKTLKTVLDGSLEATPDNLLLYATSNRRHLLPEQRSDRSEEHTSELQSRPHLVCRLLLEKKKQKKK